jgi:GNAT superfamily N-acetyltransferase
MEIEYRAELPPREEYFKLFNTTGWNEEYQVSAEELEFVNKNSWYVVSAYHGKKLVGFGRVITDYLLHAMIYDMIILPGHQNRGIGTKILEMLVWKCKEHHIRDIQLFCAIGKRSFYEKNSFQARPDDAPGMQLRKE